MKIKVLRTNSTQEIYSIDEGKYLGLQDNCFTFTSATSKLLISNENFLSITVDY